MSDERWVAVLREISERVADYAAELESELDATVAQLAVLEEAEQFRLVIEALIASPDADEANRVLALGGSLRAVYLAVEPRIAARRRAWHHLTGTGHEPTPRGYVAVSSAPVPQAEGHAAYGEHERLLYERGGQASLGTPDDEPEHGPLAPKPARIGVPKRTQVVDGAGEPAPQPWRIRPWREGERP